MKRINNIIFCFTIFLNVTRALPKFNPQLCGARKNNFTAKLGTYETTDSDSYPWLVQIGVLNDNDVVLSCSGSVVSESSILLSAHCVSEHQKRHLRVIHEKISHQVENVIIHPDYNHTHPSKQHDLAVIKITKSIFTDRVCLPQRGEDPVDNCETSTYITDSSLISHKGLNFEPSISCMETPQLRGYIDSSELIICSKTSECNMKGPVFCNNKRGVSISGLNTDSNQWCAVGAYTRIANYLEWITDTVEYLEGTTILRNGLDVNDDDNEKEDDDDPCSSNPCGGNARCWNSGTNFMCTCDDQHPEGNPYHGCYECLYNEHCKKPNSECTHNKTCVTTTPPEIPPEYFEIGDDRYLVSSDAFSWLQAQYDCQSRSGYLVEFENQYQVDNLLKEICKMNKTNGSFWIGASDFDQDGDFKWYRSGLRTPDVRFNESILNETLDNDEDKDQHCVQLSANGHFIVSSCEFQALYICRYDPEIAELGDSNGLRENRQRQFDTLNPNARYHDICGRRFVRQRRIVGGGISDYGEWPWQVSLRQYKNRQFRHKCGAAILTQSWVITAAHCVNGISPSNLLMRIGEYNILDDSEVHNHVDVRVRRVITHRQFDKFTYEYDIALIKLVSPVKFKPNIIPVCLPESNSDLVGKVGTVTGWGRRTEYGQISPILREVNLPIISNQKCMSMYRRSGQNEWIPKIFICAGTSNGGKDSCEGDSGGPLVVKSSNGRFRLAGIISWGIGCGDRNRPGVYTRISEFKDWIVANTRY